jgi:lipopolysaccharide export system permease protein
LAFWKKLFQPLETISLVLIAISFIFGPLRDVSIGYRIFTGVLTGIVFQTVQDLLGPASIVFGFSVMFAALTPIVANFFVGWLFLRRVN